MPYATKEQRTAYNRAYYRANKIRRIQGNERLKEAGYKRDPAAHRATEAVRRALQAGRLVRPEGCQQCSASGPVEASHHDYASPLTVEWLCLPCHRSLNALRPVGGAGYSVGPTALPPGLRTQCPQGHLYTPENTYLVHRAKGVSRRCRTCHVARETERKRRKRQAVRKP